MFFFLLLFLSHPELRQSAEDLCFGVTAKRGLHISQDTLQLHNALRIARQQDVRLHPKHRDTGVSAAIHGS
jgi:hypothetical protein